MGNRTCRCRFKLCVGESIIRQQFFSFEIFICFLLLQNYNVALETQCLLVLITIESWGKTILGKRLDYLKI